MYKIDMPVIDQSIYIQIPKILKITDDDVNKLDEIDIVNYCFIKLTHEKQLWTPFSLDDLVEEWRRIWLLPTDIDIMSLLVNLDKLSQQDYFERIIYETNIYFYPTPKYSHYISEFLNKFDH